MNETGWCVRCWRLRNVVVIWFRSPNRVELPSGVCKDCRQ